MILFMVYNNEDEVRNLHKDDVLTRVECLCYKKNELHGEYALF